MSESQEQQTHPEVIPDVAPSDSFLFNLNAGKPVIAALNEQIAVVQKRIDYITTNMEIKGTPILAQLLHFTRDGEDLRKLGECLVRLSALVPELDELKKRKDVLDAAMDNPMWLASVFGDYTAELDRLVEEFDK